MRDFMSKCLRWSVWIAGCCLAAACLIWIVSLTIPSRNYHDIAKDFVLSLLRLPVEDPWRKWAYDYQSIIGGILAVVAASFTVGQMRISEAENNRRHRESVDLQIRADKLRIERMLWPQRGNLRILQFELSIANDQIMTDEDDPFNRFCAYVERLKNVQTDIIKLFSLGVWKGASDLLDARLTLKQTEMNEAMRILSIALISAEKAVRYEVQQRNDSEAAFKVEYIARPEKEWQELLPRLVQAKIELETHLDDLLIELDSLARTYKINS